MRRTPIQPGNGFRPRKERMSRGTSTADAQTASAERTLTVLPHYTRGADRK